MDFGGAFLNQLKVYKNIIYVEYTYRDIYYVVSSNVCELFCAAVDVIYDMTIEFIHPT